MTSKTQLRYLILPIAFLLVIGSYAYVDKQVVESVIDADYHVFDSVQELTDRSDLIVTGYSRASVNHLTKTPEGYTDEAFTITDLQISAVLKQPAVAIVDTGQTIKPTYLYDRIIRPGKIRFSYDGYQQMKPATEYILCLKATPDGKFFVINGILQGKYSLSEDDEFARHSPEKAAKLNLFRKELKSLYGLK